MIKTAKLCKVNIVIGLVLGTSTLPINATDGATTVNANSAVEKIQIRGSLVSSRTFTESTSPIDIIATNTLSKGGISQ